VLDTDVYENRSRSAALRPRKTSDGVCLGTNRVPVSGEIETVCPVCGRHVPAQAPGGLCPGCLLRRAVEQSPNAAGASAARFAALEEDAHSADLGDDELSEELGRGVIGRYRLLEKLGEGGFGVVYAAEQEEPVKRQVALKIIKLGMDTRQVVARFESERQALALMDHANIARVLDAGATERGRPYFVMELVRGVKITDYCDQNHLSIRERLELFIQVCHAIQHAHQKGIIHRDIKPSNILVTAQGGARGVKVIDFGIAKAMEQRLTNKTVFTGTDRLIGTPAYMSPEQADPACRDIDTRSDIYSLGVLLYELLTGRPPFDPLLLSTNGVESIRRTVCEVEPVRPSIRVVGLKRDDVTEAARRRGASPPHLQKLIQGDLDWIVMKCLEKERTRRYDTANSLAMDIGRYFGSEPVMAGPPSARYVLKKFIARHKWPVALAATAAALTVAGLIGTSVGFRRATLARVLADQNAAQARQLAAEAKKAELSARLAETNALRQAYSASLNLAQQAWEQTNMARVRDLLEATAAYPNRGFEWYCWQRQTHLNAQTLRDGKEVITLKGHGGPIMCVAYSPDGRRIVTTGGDQTAKVWEAVAGKELLALEGHNAKATSVALSADGERIVAGGVDTIARVWEAATGRELITLKGHRAPIWSVAFSPDGQRIATASADNTAKVWEAATGRDLFTLKGHSALVEAVAFSPGGQRIVTGSDDHTARVWDATDGKELLTLEGHSAQVYAVAFSPDGQWIVTGSDDHTAKMWDAATGQKLFTLQGHSAEVTSVAISPDGRRIVTGSDDYTAKVWEAATGNELLTLKGHGGDINSVAFSPDGQQIVTASSDRTAKVWQAATPPQVAAWKQEAKTAAERLAALRRDQAAAAQRDQALRAHDPGAIKQWLVLAPIAVEGRNGGATLEQEQIPQEASLRPRAADRVKVGQIELVWRAVQLKDYLFDFNQFLGEVTEWSAAYAVCYVRSEVDQPGLLLKVGNDDEAKVYLNGKEIYRWDGGEKYVPDQNVVTDVELKSGLNVLVFKVVNETLDWKGSIRFTDAAGQPVKGISVSLDPNSQGPP
jgi:serine/threonine protein kinase/DNA-binding beta-propeller fold protein YncE